MTAEMERLRAQAGADEYEAGVVLYRRGAVSAVESANDALCFSVSGMEKQRVAVQADAPLDGHCDCTLFAQRTRPCRHIVAALLYAESGGLLAGARQRSAREAGAELLRALEVRMPLEQRLRVDVQLRCVRTKNAPARLMVALRLGLDRLYVVRDITTFLCDLGERAPIAFSKSFVLQPEWMRFERVDELLLGILKELVQAPAVADVTPSAPSKWLELPAAFAARVLRLLQARSFRIMVGETQHSMEQVWRSPLAMRVTVREAGQSLHLIAELPADAFALTPDCAFVFSEGSILRLPSAQRDALGVLLARAVQGRADFRFAVEDAARVVSEVLPRLARVGEVQLDSSLAHRIVRKPLSAQVYLDREGRGIVARVSFGYGEQRMDPFAPTESAPSTVGLRDTDGLLLLRDAQAEQRVLEVLSSAGFHVRMGRVCLTAAEPVVRFCTQGVHALQAVAEVYCSPEFRRLEPHRPKLAGTLKLYEGSLRLELTIDEQPAEDLSALIEALSTNRRYFMLRDGAVLDLSDLSEWAALAETLQTDAAQDRAADHGVAGDPTGLHMEPYRAAYLTSLVGASGLPVTVEEGVRRLVNSLGARSGPQVVPLSHLLRGYQVHGFHWLLALYQAKMGGILADDMGLGKTVQVIALMLWIQSSGEQERLPMLVVSPSSLVYNWQAELAQYAPELTTVVLEGSQAARAKQIAQMHGKQHVDVLITSYPLMRRDIAALTDIRFGIAVLDEAQYIKNPASVSAVAAKQLRADARFALTGTPMENHPGELWSLFDFALPGYLGGLARFLHRYGAGQNADTLRKMTGPFLLRRLKRDVLTDLPGKLETRLLAEMTVEQRRVYAAALQQLTRKMDMLLTQRALQRGRIEVLSVLTELRQICCHPALCLPDYSASSGKMDLLMDVLPGALEAGRRVLIFSQFTSMLRLLQRRMEATDISCLYLDGETSNKERIQLVRRFNHGEGQVFLISLRAGGSGLNLTGADMVVHYDPWWNPAAEDQATDRAHRIGQTKVVEVYRLITRQSIEEQVARLGERKRALFEAVVDGGAQPAIQTSDEELRALLIDLLAQSEQIRLEEAD